MDIHVFVLVLENNAKGVQSVSLSDTNYLGLYWSVWASCLSCLCLNKEPASTNPSLFFFVPFAGNVGWFLPGSAIAPFHGCRRNYARGCRRMLCSILASLSCFWVCHQLFGWYCNLVTNWRGTSKEICIQKDLVNISSVCYWRWLKITTKPNWGALPKILSPYISIRFKPSGNLAYLTFFGQPGPAVNFGIFGDDFFWTFLNILIACLVVWLSGCQPIKHRNTPEPLKLREWREESKHKDCGDVVGWLG